MNQPWGLSGPQFLCIYGAGMAAFFAAPWLLALFGRTVGTSSARVPAPELDAYEVGYLAGGAQRAAEVIIGELAASGTLRVDSGGHISPADAAELSAWSAACPHGIAADAVPDGLSAEKVRRQLAKDPGIVAIGARLRAERLLIARSWVVAARVTALALWLALMIAGALRLAEGAHNHRPIGDLGQFYMLTVLLGLRSLTWLRRLQDTRTRAGAGHLEQLGQREVVKQVAEQLAAQRKAEREAQRAERTARRAQRRAARHGGAVPADAAIASMGFAGATVPEQQPAGTAQAWPIASAWPNAQAWPIASAWPTGPLPELTAARGEGALFGIALAGLAAMEDPTLRTALLAAMPSSGGGGGCGGGGGGGGGGCGG